MKLFSKMRDKLPSVKSLILALASAGLLISAFPNFELWYFAWFALVPLFAAIENEKKSFIKSFLTGWIFGTIFFFGSTWWLTFAPITYAKIPTIIAYILLLGATSVAGLFPAFFSGVFSLCLKRFGHWGMFAAPFIWTATEFLRLWTTGNNWNAIGYSQASKHYLVQWASIGGVFLVSFAAVSVSTIVFWFVRLLLNRLNTEVSRQSSSTIPQEANNEKRKKEEFSNKKPKAIFVGYVIFPLLFGLFIGGIAILSLSLNPSKEVKEEAFANKVIAVQPNVPMSGLTASKWRNLRKRQTELAELEIEKLANDWKRGSEKQTYNITVILPESPMNFQYENDPEFRKFINDFAKRNNVSVLFNSAEPDGSKEYGYYNSAVLINEKGEKVSQYDKIYLLPFGEKVPLPESIEWIVPTMVGRFTSGVEYDLLPFGEAKAGVMICFESHFPSLSREYVRRGADVLVEMTNDGYLGNTPVLRQHLASAVFRAVETNRPVLRVTNVGVTAYVNEHGEVLDEADVYTEATKIWSVSKSDGKQTIYVKYGDWFAWFCSIVSLGLVALCFWKKKR